VSSKQGEAFRQRVREIHTQSWADFANLWAA
jgi:hypothetical protein